MQIIKITLFSFFTVSFKAFVLVHLKAYCVFFIGCLGKNLNSSKCILIDSLHVCLGKRRKSELARDNSQYLQSYRKMANTISNMKMTNPLKTIVSKKRNRYTKDGFNLDLTCILFLKLFFAILINLISPT